MANHLRRRWLPYAMLWLTLASTTSLEGGQTGLAHAVILGALALLLITGLAVALRGTGRLLRNTIRPLNRLRTRTRTR